MVNSEREFAVSEVPTFCPVCETPAVPWSEFNGTPILRCIAQGCGFRFFDLSRWKYPYRESDYYDDWQVGTVNPDWPWNGARVDILRRFKRTGRVAELGCGIGETAIALSRSGYSIVAVEESPKAINYLAQHYPSVEWINDNILAFLERHPGSFDAATMFHVLEHIPYPKDVIRLVDGALRPSGVIVIEVPDTGGGQALIKRGSWEYFADHHVNYFDLRSLDKLMSLFGYRRRFTEKTYHFSFPQGEMIKDVLKGALAWAGYNAIVRTAWTK